MLAKNMWDDSSAVGNAVRHNSDALYFLTDK